MTQIYEPEIAKDDGYSIPKIVGAILFLLLVGAGGYIYFQQKKLKTSVSYLLDSKKQVEQDLNQMIEKYNLAIDDNSSLEGDLKDERDFVIRYRDSIRNIPNKDFKEIAFVKEAVSKLKEASAIQFANANATHIEPISIEPVKASNNELPIDIKTKEKITSGNKIEATIATLAKPNTSENITSTTEGVKPADSALVANKEIVEPVEEKAEAKKESGQLTFSRVEIPPTYPGCVGTPSEKKACFSKKIKRFMSRKFDATIVDDLNIESGTKRMWVNFNVDESGNISNINARGPHEDLEKEAIRVVSSLPQMTAARQNGRSVKISYSVPITIKVP